MSYYELLPNKPLSRFIIKIWFLSCPSVHKQEKVLPLPSHHFIINLSNDPYRVVQQGDKAKSWTFQGGFVSGMQHEYLVIENPTHIHHVGVDLTPDGLSAFTNAASSKYIGTVQSSERILVGSELILAELNQIKDPQQQMKRLLTYMSTQLRADYAPPEYIKSSRKLLETVSSVADIAQQIGISQKQLSSQWKRYTGITPKRYQNIVRLQQVIAWFEQADKPILWSKLTSELSYCDQPYFIRTFRQQTGFSPREYAHMLERYTSGSTSFVALDEAFERLN